MRFDTKLSAGIGAVIGLVGACGLAFTSLGERSDTLVAAVSGAPQEPVLCMLNNAPYFDGLTTGCYTANEILQMREQDVLNQRGNSVVVMMSAPPEAAADTWECRTCADYNRMSRLGWFALSGRDQRREEFFRRACGMLAFLEKAQIAAESYFPEGTLTRDDVLSVGADSFLQITETPDHDAAGQGADEKQGTEDIPLKSALQVEQTDEGWRLSNGDNAIVIQPLAHADFDTDGLGDVLVFMRTSLRGGTAVGGTVGYFSRTSAGGDLIFQTG